MRRIAFIWITIVAAHGTAATGELTGPASVPIGSVVAIGWSGSVAAGDFISIDDVDAPERTYGEYAYPSKGLPVEVPAPHSPGRYVVRYHLAGDYAVIATMPIEATAVTAVLSFEAAVEAGGTLAVEWQGPAYPTDFISIDAPGAGDRQYGPYAYPSKGNPITIRVPDDAGDYEVRYHLGGSYTVVGSAPLSVGGEAATLAAADTIAAGASLAVRWTGPGHELDFVSIDPVAAPDRTYGPYAYTAQGNPVDIRVPDAPGSYQIRYHTGQSWKVLGARDLTVTEVSASLSAPAEVVAGSVFEVSWNGPDNEGDFITLVPIATEPARWGNSNGYTKRGNPVRIEADRAPGDYELRYLTGQTYATLGVTPLKIVPNSSAGSLRVLRAGATDYASFDNVEIVLDASGSMLGRIEGQRRIDIAKRALIGILGEFPPRTRLALRVFGAQEADSCRTDLELPLGTLDVRATQARIEAIEPKNLARTPIGASLLAVPSDLAGVTGPVLVLLVTDGEETCDGDPKLAIGALAGAGLDVRVNIVGFAIDEVGLRETFQNWASAGNGAYFDAHDDAELIEAIRAAIGESFEVRSGDSVVASGAVGGEPVALSPGTYRVRILGTDRATDVVVDPGASREVRL